MTRRSPHRPPTGRYRTAPGVLLEELLGRVATFAEVFDDLGDVAQLLTDALLDTPDIWPLDDQFVELILDLAGFDLDDCDHLDLAVSTVCYLHGTGLTDIRCGHGNDPSPLCLRASRLDDPEAFTAGTALDDRRRHAAFSTRVLASHAANLVANAVAQP